MTLVVGLRGKDHVVVAADRLGHTSDGGGTYGFKCAKLRSIVAGNRNWVVGMAGSDQAIRLVDTVAISGATLAGKSALGDLTQYYVPELCEVAARAGCDEPMWFLFAGVDSTGPFLYRLSFDGEKWHGPGEHQGNHLAIGSACHGAMYFMSAYHSPEMSRGQRMQLAHFCITEAAKHDMRVEGPVYMAIAGESEVRFVSEADVPAIVDRSKSLYASIGDLMHATSAVELEANDTAVDKAKFDAALRKMITSKPVTFKEAVAAPKPKKGGGNKRSAKNL